MPYETIGNEQLTELVQLLNYWKSLHETLTEGQWFPGKRTITGDWERSTYGCGRKSALDVLAD
jgi:hypothetical protein